MPKATVTISLSNTLWLGMYNYVDLTDKPFDPNDFIGLPVRDDRAGSSKEIGKVVDARITKESSTSKGVELIIELDDSFLSELPPYGLEIMQ